MPAASMTYDWVNGSFGPLPVIGLVYWSGVWAATMILLTLAVTPLRRILRWKNLIDARRIIGVAALLYSLVHVVGFLALYRWDWSKILLDTVTRPSLIVATVSLVGLSALGLTSFDAAVRKLGGAAWNTLHSLNYVISALAAAHFLLSPGIFGLQYLVAGLLFWLLAWRFLRFQGFEERTMGLLLLTLAAGVFTFLLQTGWLWAYQDVPPRETLEFTFSLEDEIAPPWQVLAAGLAATLASIAFRHGGALRSPSVKTIRPGSPDSERRSAMADEVGNPRSRPVERSPDSRSLRRLTDTTPTAPSSKGIVQS